VPTHRPPIIAHHLILTLYGHWLPNDLRGSGSDAFYDQKFEALGPIHRGRKPEAMQPTRQELRAFQRNAEPLLNFPKFWIDDAKRQAIGDAFADVIRERKYTVWACAILSNHAHLVVRRHRDDALGMWHAFADGSLSAMREFPDVGADHSVWSTRPYKVFLRTPTEVRGRIAYVEGNPAREGLPTQHFDFVRAHDNWPFHKVLAARSC